MVPQILHQVIHGKTDPEPWQKALISVKPAILHGYRRHRVRECDYPAIVPVNDNNITTTTSHSNNNNNDNNNLHGSTDTNVAGSSSSVLGTVVSGITDGDIHRLDLFEGDEYVRRNVKVRVLRETASVRGRTEASVAKNPEDHLTDVLDAAQADIADEAEEVDAVTYVWVAGTENLYKSEWDFELFKREKLAEWLRRDPAYW